MSLFWRIFLTNAAVLVAVGLLLIVTPVTISSPIATEELLVVGGLLLLLAVNTVLMRHAVAPLHRLAQLMRRIDPLQPGQRVPQPRQESEVRELAVAFNDMLDRLETERRESASRALAAQEAERVRIARNLHDEIGQTLTAVLLQLERTARDLPPEQHEALVEAQETARASLEDVRRIARQLRPEALDDLGLRSALTALSDELGRSAGLPIDRHLEGGLPELDPALELVIYRVAQEGLTNAVRHSGAERIELRLEQAPGVVLLRVLDDGRGMNGQLPARGGGIRGMRERALLVGADFDLHPRGDGGLEVRLSVAVPAEAG